MVKSLGKLEWSRVLANSSDVLGYAMDTGVGDIGVFYRNGSIGTDTAQANLNGDVAFSGMQAYTIPTDFSREDIIGFAWDDDGSSTPFVFFRNGSVANDTSQTALTTDLAFTEVSTYSIPSGFNASDVIGFAVSTGGTEAAVFFRNKSFSRAASEQPPFNFSSVLTYTIPSDFNPYDAVGVTYDNAADDVGMFFKNGSMISDIAQPNLNSQIDFASSNIFAVTYPSGFSLVKPTNITLQTRMSNDSVTFTSWSSNYTNPDGSESISDNVGRYVQYKAVLATPDKYITPHLLNVAINFTQGETVNPQLNVSINNTSPRRNDVVNVSANLSDNGGLSICRFVTNQTGTNEFFNISVSGANVQCHQNFTIAVTKNNTLNFTVIAIDVFGNFNQSELLGAA